MYILKFYYLILSHLLKNEQEILITTIYNIPDASYKVNISLEFMFCLKFKKTQQKPSVISQVGSRKGGVYTALSPTSWR